VGVLAGDDVLLSTEQVADCLLLHMWVFLVEFIGECESYDWQTSVVICAVLAFVVLLLALFILEVAFLAVDVAYTPVPALFLNVSS
jgi:hypothetical protein